MPTFVKGDLNKVNTFRQRADKSYPMDGDGIQAPGVIVLAFLRDNPATPYVVWFCNTQDGGIYNGDYCYTREEAEAVFDRKCNRYDPDGSRNNSFHASNHREA